jgi:hypothetical protein
VRRHPARALRFRSVANSKKTKKKRKASHPLPKVGTPKDNAYVLEHSREDLIDFGLTKAKRGPLNWIILVAVLALLVLAGISLIMFT